MGEFLDKIGRAFKSRTTEGSDLVYRFRKIEGKIFFSEQFGKLINVIKELAIAWILCGILHA